MKRLSKIYKILLCLLPAVLYFSYFPVISLGSDATMNFELSVPLIWLVLFDVFSAVVLVRERKLDLILHGWKWLIFPIFVTMSAFWSLSFTRGILTVAVMGLIIFAIFSFFVLRERMWNNVVRKWWWRVFFGSAFIICVWCVLQCIMDLAGVPRECTLMCKGCVSLMFGFPHPNGFAIEPQFMGNLLLAPAIVSGWMMLRKRKYMLLFFVFVATLFLTFSRGAIYAFAVAMIFMTVLEIARTRKWQVILVWPVIVVGFLFTLNMQGVMAEISPTNDTYMSGVAKALNHLSLGIVDIRVDEVKNAAAENEEAMALIVNNDAVFDGYVEESTEIRKYMTDSALAVWWQDFTTLVFGVGIGGAGQALYDNGLTTTPKEIVQNEYASLLLETGVIGISLFAILIVVVVRFVIKWRYGSVAILTLIVAYGVTLCFFSGFANALQIYLLPGALMVAMYVRKYPDFNGRL